MEAKVSNLFGFSGKEENPPLRNERREVKRYGPIKISQIEEFAPKGLRERTMNE